MDSETESKCKCNICLKDMVVLKCSECTFLSCNDCIVEWYNSQKYDRNNPFKCPQCKKSETFDINYDDLEENEEEDSDYEDMPLLVPFENLIISSFYNLSSNDISNILRDGQVFFPDNFVENYENWPEEIRHSWRHHPIRETIDDIEEIVAYVIEEIAEDVD
jgi:hypothetical protein